MLKCPYQTIEEDSMSWTEPKTWTNEPLVAGDLNTHLRDNLEALKEPPTAHYELNESADYSVTSTSFVNVDGTKLSLTISTSGGDVMLAFHGFVRAGTNSDTLYFDVEMDGARIGGDDGIIAAMRAASGGTPTRIPVSFVRLVTSLAAGSHTFKLQWKVSGGTGELYAGAGTSGVDLHPQFWVREVS
jgi:hypothetical protein